MANVYSVNLASSAAFSVTDHADLKPTGAFTIGMWFKTTAVASGILFQTWSNNGQPAGVEVLLSGGSDLHMVIGKNTGNTSGVDYQEFSNTPNRNDGLWHWCVWSWDTSTVRLFVDGLPGTLDTSSWSGAPAYAATNYVRLGCQNNSGSNVNFFAGNLDEVFLINGTAWLQANVNDYWKNFITGTTNLKAYWQLENDTTDSSDSHTLTAIASPTYQTDVPFVNSRFSNFSALGVG